MRRLYLFGPAELVAFDGREVRQVLSQPKRFGLLVYLALATPTGFHRRDTLLALLWPELDTESARRALRQSLHFLRSHLGGDVVEGRGMEEVRLAPGTMWCDVLAYREALEGGRLAEALELRRGELLPGFHVKEASSDFEEWLSAERARLRQSAVLAARTLAAAEENDGRLTRALIAARQAMELAPTDEETARTVMRLSQALDDPEGSLEVYEALCVRLREDDEEPAHETRRLADSIRGARRSTRADTRATIAPTRAALPGASLHGAATPLSPPATSTRDVAGPAPSVEDARVSLPDASPPIVALPRSSTPSVGTPRAVASPDRGDDARHTSWPARALLSVLLVAVAVVLVGAFEVGPAAALFVREAPARRDLIVVTDFTAPNGDTSLALVVSYAVRDGLAQSRALEVMSPSRVASTLELMERERDARVDLATAREVALREGGSAVVDGEVTQVASGYVVTARLVTADSERVLTSFKRGGDGPEGLMQIVDDLVESLRRQSGESLREVQAGVPLRRARTSSLEAARLFTEGIHASDVKVDWPLAVEKLRDAVAIDSSFAMAWLALGVMYENLGAPRSQVEDATLRAYALRDRLPSVERTAVEAAYFARGPGRDRVRAIAALRRLPHLWNNVALQYQRRREYARAESTWRAGLARDSSSRLVLRNLALNLRLQGKLGEADSVEAVLERRFGADPSVPFHRSLGAYLRGDVEPTDRAFREVARQPRASPPVLTMRANLALLRGERVHWRAVLARRRAGESGRRGGGIPIAELAAQAALESQVFGEATEALDDVERRLARDSIARLPEVDRPYIPVAAAFAWAGRPARARALLEEYARTVRDTGLLRAQRPELQSAEGAIALAEGRHREAIALFRQGDSLPDGPAHLFAARLPLQLGLTFDAANEPDSAIAWFERYLALPVMGRLEPSLDPASLARVHERLGALYEARGDSARAVASYRTFVRLWAAADPILQPRVAAARTRMDRLAAGLAATRAPDASPPTRVPLRVQPRP